MEDIPDGSIDTGKVWIWMQEAGIIENRIKNEVTLDGEDMLQMKKVNMSLAKGNNYTVLIVPGFLSGVTKDARELIASKDFVMDTVAKALLLEKLGHHIVWNFYMRVNKPVMQTRIFTERESAMEWLREALREAGVQKMN